MNTEQRVTVTMTVQEANMLRESAEAGKERAYVQVSVVDAACRRLINAVEEAER